MHVTLLSISDKKNVTGKTKEFYLFIALPAESYRDKAVFCAKTNGKKLRKIVCLFTND